MNPQKPIGGLAALVVALSVVGAAYTLAAGLVGETQALIATAFVAVVVIGLAVAGATGGKWLHTPYW